MAKKRIYQLTAQTPLTLSDEFAIDKSGNTEAKKITGQDIVNLVNDNIPTFNSVLFTQGDIIASDVTPFEILPDLTNPLEYYDDVRMMFEYRFGTTPYTTNFSVMNISKGVERLYTVSSSMFRQSRDCLAFAIPAVFGTQDAINLGYKIYAGGQLTVGDGDVLIKAYYTIRTWGV